MALIGGVEGGGTKFLAAIGQSSDEGPPEIIDELRVPTTADPMETLRPIADWLAGHPIEGLGIATFGPLDLKTGRTRDTPKPGWSGVDIVSGLISGFDTPPPTTINTDVNGAGVAEWRWGAATDADVCVYLTVGTGVGGGLIVAGRPVHGEGHPEMGHVTVERHPDDSAVSVCRYHAACLEGVASGPAFAARAGRPAEQVTDEALWDLEAHYLAAGLADITLTTSTDVFVIGGGIMQRSGLLQEVAHRLDGTLGGYVKAPEVVAPHFGQRAGLFGALALGIAPSS
jgi:fructokinase